ncbi:hypothetical protein BHM03_00050708, partial [Ensete ventricosum]
HIRKQISRGHFSSSGRSDASCGSSPDGVRSRSVAVIDWEARHSCAASCGLEANGDGEASLQSAKYLPETPTSRGCVAT